MIKVKRANLQNLSALVKYAKHAHENSDYSDIPFNSALTRKNFRKWLTHPAGAIFIALDDGICGFIIGMLDEVFFAHKVYATDIEFFADKGGNLLIDEFKKWAVENNSVRVYMGVSNTNDRSEEVLNRFYRSCGFDRTGNMYCMRLLDE